MRILLIFLIAGFLKLQVNAQTNPPWERPLKIAWSVDGTFFTNETIFQDSSGVPSAIRWKGDTIVCVFQWFRAPVGSLTWDRVAVKFSYDAGVTWTMPVPVVVNGLPVNYQRPFDPTLSRISSNSIRIYFSSSDGLPPMGLDSTVNTYSAISSDGINYAFEPGARFDHPTNKAIDPAVLFFNGLWHYTCPIGPPQAGAYHAISTDGLSFIQQPDLPSDSAHNWTGNLLYESNSLMKFYGSGSAIWHNSTQDGFTYNGYVATNLTGGDPTAVKIAPTNYFMIYTGPPYITVLGEPVNKDTIFIFPNPVNESLSLSHPFTAASEFVIYDASGKPVKTGKLSMHNLIEVQELSAGWHLLGVKLPDGSYSYFRFIKN
ncbi:MAG: T9SS type A sorting domain-containing protein [Bacteroidota bacterium]|nr:T9SS type A sorting domain-containing protein [Bacteroidota bacterium]